MTASYPGAIRTWSTKLGWRNIVWASHVNDLQLEVAATQAILGLSPHVSTNDPGGRARDYATVNGRMTAHARGEAMPYFRSQVADFKPAAGVWVDVPITGADALKADPFLLASPGGVRLNSTGMWMVEARTEWKATGYTGANKARRELRVLVNGADVGLIHHTDEDARNSFALHNAITWMEPLPQGAQITVQVLTGVESPPAPEPPATPTPGTVWTCPSASWRLIRCWNGSQWEHYTGDQDTDCSSPTPLVPNPGRLWIDTSEPFAVPKVYSGGAWLDFTGLDDDLFTTRDSATAPTSPVLNQVWVDTQAQADLTREWWDDHWRPVYARNCLDGHGDPVPTPPPTTPTTPDYGLAVNVSLRLHQLRVIKDLKPVGGIRSARDSLIAA